MFLFALFIVQSARYGSTTATCYLHVYGSVNSLWYVLFARLLSRPSYTRYLHVNVFAISLTKCHLYVYSAYFHHVLFTRILLRPFTTPLALHVAAPVKLTLTLPDLGVLMGVVATPTTHQIAAVRAVRCPVAVPAHRAQ